MTTHTAANGPRSAWARLSDRMDGGPEGYGPLRGSLGAPRIGMIWLAANLVVTTLLTGTLFVPGVSWPQALGLIVLGTAIGGTGPVAGGNMGPAPGVTPMSRAQGAFW